MDGPHLEQGDDDENPLMVELKETKSNFEVNETSRNGSRGKLGKVRSSKRVVSRPSKLNS